MANTVYWMEHELRKSSRVELDHAGGRDSRDQLTYQPNRVLVKRLGREIVDFPGGHLGFLSSPAEFAKELTNACKD